MKRWLSIMALGLAVASIGAANAQRDSSVYVTGRGEGKLEVGDERALNVREVSVNLRRGGDAEVSVRTPRGVESFRGTWSGRSRLYTIEIKSGFGSSRTTGSGRVYLDSRDQLDRMTLSGRTSDGDRFNLNFEARDRNDDRNNDRSGRRPDRWNDDRRNDDRLEKLSNNKWGNGVLRVSGDKDKKITWAAVELKDNGDAEVRFRGDTRLTFKGRWSGNRNNVRIDIREGLGRNTDGRATVRLNSKREIERIDIDGRTDRKSYSIDFDSR